MRKIIIATAALLASTAAIGQSTMPQARVDPARMSDTVKTIASDRFGGRAPGTAGEKTTLDYLVGRFKALGLEPAGPDGQWLQRVPMVHTQIGDGTLSITTPRDGTLALRQPADINVTTVVAQPHIAIRNAPLVFVGYGVTAPEAKWDDYKGVDLHGKIAVFLVNDPDYEASAGDDAQGRFGGRRMTYYGRWTYKFEEAARRGAAGALIIHDTGAAGYGWQTVAASHGENYDIVRAPDAPQIALQGWIQHDLADRLFADAGLDLARLRVEARSANFHPVELTGERFTADLPVDVQRIESANVLAKRTGTRYPQETVMFGAHWDAYGQGPADAQGRTIRRGANDDGLGVAGVLELARLFKAAPKTERTTVFALWTGEERGLLGSEYYALHPVFPLGKTVANLTLDILETAGRSKDVIQVGVGNSSLDADLRRAAAAQGRTVTPEALAERGLFYRADHFSLAKRGVPALLLMAISGTPDLRQGGTAAGQAWLDGYMKCYHQTCDSWSSDWDLSGAAEDVDLFYAIGRNLANSHVWPTWTAASGFQDIRAQTAADRK